MYHTLSDFFPINGLLSCLWYFTFGNSAGAWPCFTSFLELELYGHICYFHGIVESKGCFSPQLYWDTIGIKCYISVRWFDPLMYCKVISTGPWPTAQSRLSPALRTFEISSFLSWSLQGLNFHQQGMRVPVTMYIFSRTLYLQNLFSPTKWKVG